MRNISVAYHHNGNEKKILIDSINEFLISGKTLEEQGWWYGLSMDETHAPDGSSFDGNLLDITSIRLIGIPNDERGSNYNTIKSMRYYRCIEHTPIVLHPQYNN